MNKQHWILIAALILVGTFARAQTVEYIHTDALGSPVAVTNAGGAVIERTVYEPYGAVINRPLTNGPGYTGHVLDAVTGLNYMQQRYYDPALGRFLSVDPVTATSIGANFNRYWYANNNPYKYIDPDGRCSTGTIIGACVSRLVVLGGALGGSMTRGTATRDGGSRAKSREIAHENARQQSAEKTTTGDGEEPQRVVKDTTGAGEKAQKAVDAEAIRKDREAEYTKARAEGNSDEYYDNLDLADKQLRRYHDAIGQPLQEGPIPRGPPFPIKEANGPLEELVTPIGDPKVEPPNIKL